jgi:autotransporter-associated beta strand protein
VAPSTAHSQTLINYVWSGSTSTDFSTTTNWTSGTVAPTGGSFTDSRITVGNFATASTRELIYSAAQGNTTYTNTGTFNQSGLFIGAFSETIFSASMRITGGSFTSHTERADGMASNGNGTLTIAGGAYTKTGSNRDFAVKWMGNGTGTLNVESGSFSAGRIVYGLAGSSGAGVVNLTGGTTTVNQILESFATTSTLNLAGGTLRAGADQSNLITVDTARVSAGGARIDTQGFAVTIAQALLENGTSTGGGLTKLGAGRLTLSGSNAYTGSTTISGGTLALGAAGSFANSSAIIVGSAGSAGAVLDLTAKTGGFSIGAGQLLGGGGTVRLASSGTLNVLGTFSPGNSPGLFTYDAGTTVLSGTTLMEIFGTSRATSPSHGSGFYDAVDIVNNGSLQFGGMLTLEFSSLFANNTTFDLFTPAAGSSLAGNFTGVNVGGSFYTGLSWNQTGDTWKSSNTVGGQSLEFSSATGQLVIVPEPAGLALAGIGIAAAASAYRRRRS